MVENHFINWNRYLLISLWVHVIGIAFYFHAQNNTFHTMQFNKQISMANSSNNSLAITFQNNVADNKVASKSAITKQNMGINKNSKQLTTIIAKNPSFAKQTPLYYPPRAVEMGLMGTVLLRALVNNVGDIEKIVIVQSSKYKILDDATLNTVLSWKINPIIKNNVALSGWVEFAVNYNISP